MGFFGKIVSNLFFLSVLVFEFIDSTSRIYQLHFTSIIGCESDEISIFINGYSLPSSHLIESLELAVDLVKIEKPVEISCITTSL